MRVRASSLAIALLASACSDAAAPDVEVPRDVTAPDAPDAGDELAHDFAFDLGTHELNQHRPQSTHDVRDRSALEVVTGSQGLRMIVLVPRVHDDVTLPLTALAQIESGPELLGSVDIELPPPSRELDGTLAFHDLYLLLGPTSVAPDDWSRLRVVLTDADGRRSELRRTTRLTLPDG